MSTFGIIMSGFCVAAVMLILWLLATEADEALRRRRMTPTERRLADYADEVEARYRATDLARGRPRRTPTRKREVRTMSRQEIIHRDPDATEIEVAAPAGGTS
jgi:hypothetical protein